ncbi:MAG: low-specificity L-threonine aldolase [Dehalococcoidia bacterium]|nr:low-specificity L-threonine aldolase [Dehalococcoidia bacterium]
MRIIDLRSDTVTLPTEEMRRAMYEAEVGDDVYGEDPTINKLEELSAQTLGKEAGLFTVSGTMSNLIAILVHTQPGDEIILGDEAHILWHELGSAAALGGTVLRTIPNKADGSIDPDIVEQTIRPESALLPKTTLLCLENTHNRCGGTVLTPEYTSSVVELAHQHGLQVHIDGARIFNAAVALDVPVSKLSAPADSICFCLSKSLSAPIGSVLCGTHDFVERARKRRKMLGGGMRQAGIIAAAGIVAIQKMVDRLAEDHANAKRLAQGLSQIPGIIVDPGKIQTNIVFFEPPTDMSALDFTLQMKTRGVKFNALGRRMVRAVTHRMLTSQDIDEALGRINDFVKEM